MRDDVPRVAQHTAVSNIMQLKLNIVCQTLRKGGGLFSGANHIVTQRKISTLKQLAEAAQYCIVKDPSSMQQILKKNHQIIRDVKHEVQPKQLVKIEENS